MATWLVARVLFGGGRASTSREMPGMNRKAGTRLDV